MLQNPKLLLDTHAADNSAHSYVLHKLHRNYCFNHILDLDCQLSGRRKYQSFDFRKTSGRVLVQLLDQNIEYRHSKTECFALTGLSSYNHVDMRLQVYE